MNMKMEVIKIKQILQLKIRPSKIKNMLESINCGRDQTEERIIDFEDSVSENIKFGGNSRGMNKVYQNFRTTQKSQIFKL